MENATLEIFGGSETNTLTIKETGETFVFQGNKTVISPKQKRLWTPDAPNLYNFTLESGNDKIESYFALREIGITNVSGKERITLNGAPYLFNGLLDQGYFPDGIFLPELYRKYRAGDAVLRKAYQHLLSEGVKNLYYLSHQELGLGEDSWIEGVHPNDLGNREYADAYKKKLKEILSEDIPNPRYMPTRQFRDGSYDWTLRHNEVMRQNRTTDPEILMIGNSITHGWQWDASWEKMFKGRRVTNMGFGSDRIENVYWRIFHGELEGCKPSTICLQIGINNLAKGEREEDIASGIVVLHKSLKRLFVY